VRRIGFDGCHHLRFDQFAFTRNRHRYPFPLRSIVAHGDQVKAREVRRFPSSISENVAYRNDPASSQDHAFQFRCSMGKAKNTAWSNEFGNLVRRDGEPPFAQAQQDKGLQFEFGRYRHCAPLVLSRFSLAVLSASKRAASSRVSSSGDKNPSGCTTGTTV